MVAPDILLVLAGIGGSISSSSCTLAGIGGGISSSCTLAGIGGGILSSCTLAGIIVTLGIDGSILS